MPRNRMIKADFWADEKVGKLTADAKLMFIGAWNFSDDTGVFRGNYAYLKSNIFPYNDKITCKNIRELCKELVDSDLVMHGTFNGESYYLVKNFHKHQIINRPSKFCYIVGADKHNILELFDSVSTHTLLSEGSLMKVKEKEKVKVKVSDAEASDKFLYDVLDLWNRNVDELGLPKVRHFTDARIRKLKKACKDFKDIEDWKNIFTIAARVSFIKTNGEQFIPNWDWIFKNDNYIKFYEESQLEKPEQKPSELVAEVESMLLKGL